MRKSGYQTALRCLKFVNDAHRSFRADLIGIEEVAGDTVDRNSQGHVPMVAVQIHARAHQTSERARSAIGRLRIDEYSSNQRVRPYVNALRPHVAKPRTQ